MSATPLPGSARLHDLDWLRVIALAGIFVFHSGSAYSADDWHFISADKSQALKVIGAFLLIWAMPLLFAISGMSAEIAISTRPMRQFLVERVDRLLMPLAFGILVVVPPQVYIERISRGQFEGSFLSFYSHYFNAPYLEIGGTGNFAWMGLHLWYLLALFIFTLACLPLMNLLRSMAHRLDGSAASPCTVSLLLVLLPAVPLILVDNQLGNEGLGGWNMLSFVLFYVAGLMFANVNGSREGLARAAPLAAIVASASALALLLVRFSAIGLELGPYRALAQDAFHGLAGWASVVAMLGLGVRFLRSGNTFLAYASEAVLPFYILHQTCIVLVAYWIDGAAFPVWIKYAVVLILGSGLSIAIFELLIRRHRMLRPLFGLRS